MKQVALFLSVLFVTAGFARSGRAAEPPKQPASVLADVKELDTQVTYTETKIPLGELIQKVVQDTGARLTAAKDVADEPVAVVVKDLPARELLEQLADLLDYRWSRKSARQVNALPHFEIYQDVASKQREAALRQAINREAKKHFQDLLKRAVELAAMPQDEFDRLLAEGKQARKEQAKLSPEHWRALMRSPEGRERSDRFFTALQFSAPVQRVMAGLLGRITPEQWQLLYSEEPITFSTRPERGELPLPAEIGHALKAAQPTLDSPTNRTRAPDSYQAEQARLREKNLQEQWAAAPGYRITLHMQVSRWQSTGSISLQGVAEALRPGVQSPFSSYVAGLRISLDASGFDPLQSIPEKSPELQSLLEKDPVLGVKKSVATEAKPQPDFYSTPQPPTWPLRDLLPDLARLYGVNFVSDAYSIGGGVVFARTLAGPISLCAFLDEEQHSYSIIWDRVEWTDASGASGRPLIRMRSRTWFLSRPKEIPMRLVRRWKALFEEHGGLPLEEWLRIAGTLSDAQLEDSVSLTRSGDLPPTADILTGSMGKYTLRLFASLSPDQQQLLWRGGTVPLTRMNDRQRALFAAAAHEVAFFRKTPTEIADPEAAGLSLATGSLVRVEERHGNESRPSTRMESLHPPRPGGPRPAPGTSPAPSTVPPGPPGTSGAAAAQSGLPASGTLRRFPMTLIHFQLHYGPDQQDVVALQVPASDPSVKPGPSDDRPPVPPVNGGAP